MPIMLQDIRTPETVNDAKSWAKVGEALMATEEGAVVICVKNAAGDLIYRVIPVSDKMPVKFVGTVWDEATQYALNEGLFDFDNGNGYRCIQIPPMGEFEPGVDEGWENYWEVIADETRPIVHAYGTSNGGIIGVGYFLINEFGAFISKKVTSTYGGHNPGDYVGWQDEWLQVGGPIAPIANYVAKSWSGFATYAVGDTLYDPALRVGYRCIKVPEVNEFNPGEDSGWEEYWEVYNVGPAMKFVGAYDSSTEFFPGDVVYTATATYLCTTIATDVSPGVASGWEDYWKLIGILSI